MPKEGSRRDFLSKKYDELYKKASEIVKKHNVCNIQGGVCSKGRRVEDGLCCRHCRHLGPNGCTVKSLGCRIWLCYCFHKDYPSPMLSKPYWKDMDEVLKEAESYKICQPRYSKWKSINLALMFDRQYFRTYNHKYERPPKEGRVGSIYD